MSTTARASSPGSMLTRRWSDIDTNHTGNFAGGNALRFSRGRTCYFHWGCTGCTASRGRQYEIWSNRRRQLHRGHLRGSVRRSQLYPILTQGAPHATPPDRGKPAARCGSFADTDRDQIRVSEEANKAVIKHQGPFGGQHRPGPSEYKHVRPSERQRWASQDCPRTSEHQLEHQHHMGSLYHRHLRVGPPERRLRHRQGSADQQRLRHPGVATSALELRPRPKLTTETDSELKGIRTLTVVVGGQPRANPRLEAQPRANPWQDL